MCLIRDFLFFDAMKLLSLAYKRIVHVFSTNDKHALTRKDLRKTNSKDKLSTSILMLHSLLKLQTNLWFIILRLELNDKTKLVV